MGSFKDLRVLVVEDEPLIGLDVAETLRNAGCEVIGPHRTVDTALRAIMNDPPEVVLLDFTLGRENSVSVADVLERARVPFIWVTDYTRDSLPKKHRDRPWVSKPFSSETLLGALVAARMSDLQV